MTFKLQTAVKKVIGKMGAHKFVLMSRSPVFFAMFEGPMKEKSDEIAITDIEGEPFRQFLRSVFKVGSKSFLHVPTGQIVISLPDTQFCGHFSIFSTTGCCALHHFP